MSDLGDLLYKIFDNWGEGAFVFRFRRYFILLFNSSGETGTDVSDCKHTYLSNVLIRDGISDDHVLRNEYGWFQDFSLEDLTEIYEDCEKTNHKTRKIDV